MAFCSKCFEGHKNSEKLSLRTIIHKTQFNQHTLQRGMSTHTEVISGENILKTVSEAKLQTQKFCIWDKPLVPKEGTRTGPQQSGQRGSDADGDSSGADSTAGDRGNKAAAGGGLNETARNAADALVALAGGVAVGAIPQGPVHPSGGVAPGFGPQQMQATGMMAPNALHAPGPLQAPPSQPQMQAAPQGMPSGGVAPGSEPNDDHATLRIVQLLQKQGQHSEASQVPPSTVLGLGKLFSNLQAMSRTPGVSSLFSGLIKQDFLGVANSLTSERTARERAVDDEERTEAVTAAMKLESTAAALLQTRDNTIRPLMQDMTALLATLQEYDTGTSEAAASLTERSKHVQHEYRYNQHAKVQEKYDVMEAFYAYAPSVRSVLSEAFDPEMESALQKVKQSLDTLQGPVPHPGPQVPKVVIDHLEDSVIKDKLSRKLHGLNSCAVSVGVGLDPTFAPSFQTSQGKRTGTPASGAGTSGGSFDEGQGIPATQDLAKVAQVSNRRHSPSPEDPVANLFNKSALCDAGSAGAAVGGGGNASGSRAVADMGGGGGFNGGGGHVSGSGREGGVLGGNVIGDARESGVQGTPMQRFISSQPKGTIGTYFVEETARSQQGHT
ncbi:hypothetical protein PLESTB_001420900 [Pleodorina starrii]|uniref:Uncharacterized protein n=1 Tax=Pleodorina starrii TaxID=330485 RepID=A0A9W6BVF8_9CHLO|nr:hypothetical protein PLESTB_001420900 [Pleodorina starrii]